MARVVSQDAGCRGAVLRSDWRVGGRVSAYCGTTNARRRCDMDHGRRSGISCRTRFIILELHGIIRGIGGGQEGLRAAWLRSWAICGLEDLGGGVGRRGERPLPSRSLFLLQCKSHGRSRRRRAAGTLARLVSLVWRLGAITSRPSQSFPSCPAPSPAVVCVCVRAAYVRVCVFLCT
jgi:hypothetical protein